ncbi:MAG: 3-phosphoshikimate 1-carboxyvinyltransferase, partial [Pseudomonadota bacterium]
MQLIVRPSKRRLSGTITPPGDKSVSHRAAILGGLAQGTTTIHGFLTAEDTLATLQAMADLGVQVERAAAEVQITGRGLHAPQHDLDLGNSGTGMRLLAGALAGHPDLYGQRLRLVGDESLSSRPMRRIIEPLTAMGADMEGVDGHAPLTIRPRPLQARAHDLNIASAQVKSAILLAGLQAEGHTRVSEPGISRDHTERMLPAFGVELEAQAQQVDMRGPQALQASTIQVPADLSSAAFLIAAALLVP